MFSFVMLIELCLFLYLINNGIQVCDIAARIEYVQHSPELVSEFEVFWILKVNDSYMKQNMKLSIKVIWDLIKYFSLKIDGK